MHLCTLAAFVLCVVWSASAAAVVPMCGARGQSIAAPPIGTPASDAALSAGTPCEQAGPLYALGVLQREAPRQLSFYELPTRALPVVLRVAACPSVGRVSITAGEQEPIATNFARSIDRPPRS